MDKLPDCEWCGAVVPASKPKGQPRKFCSRACSHANYRARKIAADPVGFRAKLADATRRSAARHPDRTKANKKRWRASHRDQSNAARRRWRGRNVVVALVMEARARARKRGVAFTITAADVPPIGSVCPLLGHPFAFRTGESRRGAHPNAPSLDRIDPAKGYVRGNVWVVGYRANLIKNDGTAEEHEKIAAAVRAALSGPQ